MQWLCVITCLALGAVAQTQEKPEFCKGLDCPLFTETAASGYAVRQYTAATTWVGTSEEQYTLWAKLGVGLGGLFSRLFRYIEDNTIPMTAPVLTEHEELTPGWFGRTKVTMWFYLAGRAPQPVDPSVTLTTLPSGLTVFVMPLDKKLFPVTFPWEWQNKLVSLRSAVGEGRYVANRYFTAQYDEPSAIYKHNEVMLVPAPQK